MRASFRQSIGLCLLFSLSAGCFKMKAPGEATSLAGAAGGSSAAEPMLWPLPTPTASYPLFAAGEGPFAGGTTPLKAVSDHLEAVLRDHGYDDLWWYAAPNGFVIFTHVEQFEESGASIQGEHRFVPGFTPPRIGDSFTQWLGYMLRGKRGRYRVFAFVVTDDVVDPGRPPTRADVAAWEGGDPGARPKILRTGVYGPDHHCNALIYEFERHNADDVLHFVDGQDSKLGHRQHLEETGLLPDLLQPARSAGVP